MKKTEIDKLEEKQHLLREKTLKGDYSNWADLNPTKLLLLQLKIDSEELKENWRYYSDDELKRAKGQADYIEGLIDIVNDIGGYNATSEGV